MTTVRITIKVRKYLWSEFVRDVCIVIYVAIMIPNALSKRYFNRSIPEIYRSAENLLKHTILFLALLAIGFVALLFIVGIPLVLLLVALGKISP